MSLRAYNRLFFALLGIGLVALGVAMALALFSAPNWKEIRLFGGFALATLGCAFLANSACGLQHKEMRAKDGIMSYKQDGKSFFIFIPLNIGLGIVFLTIAIRIWCNAAPIHL
jgi:FtsH-binding integral membrane protein